MQTTQSQKFKFRMCNNYGYTCLVNLVFIIIAVYLSYKCNENKWNPLHVLAAIFFPFFYLLYIGIRGCKQV